MDKEYTVRPYRDHYAVFLNEIPVVHCDTHREAMEELEELQEGGDFLYEKDEQE